MLCGLELPSVNFASKKPLHFACCLTKTAPAIFWSIKISDFLSKPGRIFKFSLALWLSLYFVTLFAHGHLRACLKSFLYAAHTRCDEARR